MDLRINRNYLSLAVLAGAALLSLAGAGAEIYKQSAQTWFPVSLVTPFDLDRDANLPTWFSSTCLMISALLMAWIGAARTPGRDRKLWLTMAFIFVYLSIDEAAELHEITIAPLRKLLGLSGVFHFAWVIPFGLALVVLTLIYFRFWWSLPLATRIGLLLAALVYVGGAMGLEMYGSLIAAAHGEEYWLYRVSIVIEETMEMVGLWLLIRTLAGYGAANCPPIRIRIG